MGIGLVCACTLAPQGCRAGQCPFRASGMSTLRRGSPQAGFLELSQESHCFLGFPCNAHADAAFMEERWVGADLVGCPAPPWKRIKLHPEPGSGFGCVSHAPTLCRRADGAGSVGNSFLQHPGDGDRLAGQAGPAHPFPPCSKVPPAMPCGRWATKSPPPLWLRRSRSPRCRGAGAVSASSPGPHALPAPPFLSSLPLLLPQSKRQGWGPRPGWPQSGCRYRGPHCS